MIIICVYVYVYFKIVVDMLWSKIFFSSIVYSLSRICDKTLLHGMMIVQRHKGV